MCSFDWNDDSLWQIRITDADLAGFIRPYIGNGYLGTRFTELVVGYGEGEPLWTLTKSIYDGGTQQILPVWNDVFVEAGGVPYRPDRGRHRLEQILDLRTGTVSLSDKWEYAAGRVIDISIRMMVPRVGRNCSFLSIDIERIDKPVKIAFGLHGAHVRPNFSMKFSRAGERTLIGDYLTAVQQRPVAQALRWEQRGLSPARVVLGGGEANLEAESIGGRVNLVIYHCIHGPAESGNPHDTVLEEVTGLERHDLADMNAVNWRELWKDALAFDHREAEIKKMFLAHQFYLLGSMDRHDFPSSALGVSAMGWRGSHFWDADVWIFRALLPLWPDLARSIVDYRFKGLEHAKRHARDNGYRGAWYPWSTDDAGRNTTGIKYETELHVGIWIALAAWEYYLSSGDGEFLETRARPIISGVADFFASRALFEEDGFYHIRRVIGPDEAVIEAHKTLCDDHFLTNFGVRELMRMAMECAGKTGRRGRRVWKDVYERIYVQKPGRDGVIPEYEGYRGEGIKQADVILAFYPFDYEADEEIILRNIEYYQRTVSKSGPFMNEQIESCLMMRVGQREKGLEYLLESIGKFVRGKHFIVFESTGNDNGVMLTSIGGELQALIYGYYGAEIGNYAMLPRVGERW